MRLLLFLFVFFFVTKTWSSGIVSKINNHTQVLVEISDPKHFKVGRKVVIISAKDHRAVAIGEIHDFVAETDPVQAKIDVLEIIGNNLILLGDEVEPVNREFFRKEKIPGFNSLSLSGSDKIPSQYKELAYFGVFTSDGHALDRHEVLLSPFQVQYGITNKVTVKVINALWLDGYANAGAKYNVLKNKYAKITVNGLGAYKVQDQDWIAQVGGVITVPSNAKFQSHFMGNFILDPQYSKAKATHGLNLYTDSDIRSITEYITDNWNRILFGPVYNVELQTFGGTVSYMWIWDTFHMSLGLGTRNFAKLNFSSKGYYAVYDVFWRF